MSKKYELMYILKPELDEAGVKAENANLQKILTDHGAKIVDVAEWGLRDLAYEIKKSKKGYYVVVTFENQEQKAIDEFERLTRNNANVLRFLLTIAK